jgi:hypothetical protein
VAPVPGFAPRLAVLSAPVLDIEQDTYALVHHGGPGGADLNFDSADVIGPSEAAALHLLTAVAFLCRF